MASTHRWCGFALLSLVCATALAQAPPVRDAVLCQAVSAKGQPISPDVWFPAGTRSLTVWFRAGDVPPGTKAEVHWTLKGTTLTKQEVTLQPDRAAWHRYALGLDEPLPNGQYEAVIRVGGTVAARVRAQVGGERPRSEDVTAVSPAPEPARPGSATLRRASRTPGAVVPVGAASGPAEQEPAANVTATPAVSIRPTVPDTAETLPVSAQTEPIPSPPAATSGSPTGAPTVPAGTPAPAPASSPVTSPVEPPTALAPPPATPVGAGVRPEQPPAAAAALVPSAASAPTPLPPGTIVVPVEEAWPGAAAPWGSTPAAETEWPADLAGQVDVAEVPEGPLATTRAPTRTAQHGTRRLPEAEEGATVPPGPTSVPVTHPSVAVAVPRAAEPIPGASEPRGRASAPRAPTAAGTSTVIPPRARARATGAAASPTAPSALPGLGSAVAVMVPRTSSAPLASDRAARTVGPPAARGSASGPAEQPTSERTSEDAPVSTPAVASPWYLDTARGNAVPRAPTSDSGPRPATRVLPPRAAAISGTPPSPGSSGLPGLGVAGAGEPHPGGVGESDELLGPLDAAMEPSAVATPSERGTPDTDLSAQAVPMDLLVAPGLPTALQGPSLTPGQPPPGRTSDETVPRTASGSVGSASTTTPPEPPPPSGPVQPEPERPVRLKGPLSADAVAEDLPPVQLPADAVKLYRVELVPVDEPAGLQPLWLMRVPDGRLWPPGLPTQFGLYAGEIPDPSPGDLLLYSDHIDGVIPLYQPPIQEVRLHAARENEAGLLFLSRELFDRRRAAWQKTTQGWRWMWYVRNVDLERGQALVACLTDVGRSRRAPADFAPTVTEETYLLDQTGNRVPPRPAPPEVQRQVVASLGGSDRGIVGLGYWVAPTAGRYQVWAALPLDRARATCRVWTGEP